MKRILSTVCHFFGSLSVLNVSGVMKVSLLFEPLPPHLREEAESTKKS